MKYYLITLKQEGQGRTQSYWARDEGDRWANLVKNVWVPKEEYRVVEAAEADHETGLDWSKTPLFDNSLESGWLSRDGRFYGCPSYLHDKLAACVLGLKVPELEAMGWVRIYTKEYFTCAVRLSAEQRNWLSENCYKVEDFH